MKVIKTAAYCRVSTEHEEQDSSLEFQVEYFQSRILSDPRMELVEIFAEKASGLNMKERPEFNHMMSECRKGRIKLILTKSVSRFGSQILSEQDIQQHCLNRFMYRHIHT